MLPDFVLRGAWHLVHCFVWGPVGLLNDRAPLGRLQ